MFKIKNFISALPIILLIGGVSYSAKGFSETMADMLIKAEKKNTVIKSTNNMWSVHKGEKLRDALYRWSKSQGWNMIWRIDYDLELSADASFSGNMAAAINELLTSVNQNGMTILARMYPENKVLLIKAGIDNQ